MAIASTQTETGIITKFLDIETQQRTLVNAGATTVDIKLSNFRLDAAFMWLTVRAVADVDGSYIRDQVNFAQISSINLIMAGKEIFTGTNLDHRFLKHWWMPRFFPCETGANGFHIYALPLSWVYDSKDVYSYLNTANVSNLTMRVNFAAPVPVGGYYVDVKDQAHNLIQHRMGDLSKALK
jgi:hypothetical protein